jgi:hypothetical protein
LSCPKRHFLSARPSRSTSPCSTGSPPLARAICVPIRIRPRSFPLPFAAHRTFRRFCRWHIPPSRGRHCRPHFEPPRATTIRRPSGDRWKKALNAGSPSVPCGFPVRSTHLNWREGLVELYNKIPAPETEACI